MGLFAWLFGVGDEVEDNTGRTGKVVGHKQGGFVDVRYPDGKGGSKVESKFGGNLSKNDSKGGKK